MIPFLFQNLRKKNGSKNSFHKRVASSAEKVKKAKKHGLKRIKKDISSEARSNAKVRIENMTYFIPPDQPQKSYEIFGSGRGSQLAKENNVPLLSQIPIETDTFSGTGKDLPVVHTSRDSITAKVFLELAGTLCNALSVKQ